jgi:hypothetical protein
MKKRKKRRESIIVKEVCRGGNDETDLKDA